MGLELSTNRPVYGEMLAVDAVVGPYQYRYFAGDAKVNQVQLIVAGTWVGTVTVQISYPGKGQWTTLMVLSGNISEALTLGGAADIRAVMSAYTSGTAYVGFSC